MELSLIFYSTYTKLNCFNIELFWLLTGRKQNLYLNWTELELFE